MNRLKRAVVLLSGGVDSSTALAIAKAEGFEPYALTFDYGQRHALELQAARTVAENLGVKKHLTLKFDLREIGGSALTADIEVPTRPPLFSDEGKAPSTHDRDSSRTGSGAFGPGGGPGAEPPVNKTKTPGSFQISNLKSEIPITYVPARNTIFLSFALSWAEVLGAADIFIGANAVDYSGYPDCRPEYLKAFEDMANLATKVSVEGKIKFRINAPLILMTKGEIIKKGISLGLDYSLTWSCYDPKIEKGSATPCLKCDSCRFRAKGFMEAGIKDPLV